MINDKLYTLVSEFMRARTEDQNLETLRELSRFMGYKDPICEKQKARAKWRRDFTLDLGEQFLTR